MDKEKIEEIRNKDLDVDHFSNKVIEDGNFRDQVVGELLTNRDIMVYYHCYYIVSRASELKPELFYSYWDKFVPLLNHKNSYHRDIGITVLANLTRVDEKHYFDYILEDYLSHIDDEKFMTSECLVKNLAKIVKHRPDLRSTIIDTLLDIDKITSHTEKQTELLKSSILGIFESVYEEMDDKERINRFIKSSVDSKSPKTRKKAKELAGKYF